MSHFGLGRRRLRVLVVEDDASTALEIEATLDEAGYEVISASSLDDARLFGDSNSFDCVVLDIQLKEGDSALLAEWLSRQGVPLVVTSRLCAADSGNEALKAAPKLDKPFCDEQLVAAVSSSIARWPVQVA